MDNFLCNYFECKIMKMLVAFLCNYFECKIMKMLVVFIILKILYLNHLKKIKSKSIFWELEI